MTQSGSLGNTQREADWLIPVLTGPGSVFWSNRNRNQQVQSEHCTGWAVEPQWFLRHKSSAPPPFLPPNIAQQQTVAPLITKALLQLLGETVPSFSLYAPTLPESPGSAKWFSASLRIQRWPLPQKHEADAQISIVQTRKLSHRLLPWLDQGAESSLSTHSLHWNSGFPRCCQCKYRNCRLRKWARLYEAEISRHQMYQMDSVEC